MLPYNFLGLLAACFVLVKAADYAIRAVSRIAAYYHISEYITSFLLAGIVSTLPEASVIFASAMTGTTELGLGAVLGNNLVDLTLVLGFTALFGKSLFVKSKSVENDIFYLILCLLPFLLALDSSLSRIDGVILLLSGGLYLGHIVKESRLFHKVMNNTVKKRLLLQLLIFASSVTVLFVAATYVVEFSTSVASELGISSFLVGLTVIALGSALPELAFSLKARKSDKNEVSLGNLLGNIVIDATIVIGLVAAVSPFEVRLGSLLSVGVFTAVGLVSGLVFMRTGWELTKREGIVLVVFYVLFLIAQVLFQ